MKNNGDRTDECIAWLTEIRAAVEVENYDEYLALIHRGTATDLARNLIAMREFLNIVAENVQMRLLLEITAEEERARASSKSN